jgi:hypothetical protein
MTAPQEQRAHQRTKTLYKGKVVAEGRFSLIDCTVRDLSESGARIEFGATYAPAPEFELEIPSKQMRFWARLVWSSGLRHGVAFFEPETKRDMAPLNEDKAFKVQAIIEEARQRIAEAAGVRPDSVKLTLDLPNVKV